MQMHETRRVERAVLAQVLHSRMDPAEAADSLLELARLADTAGLEVAGQLTQNREKPSGGTMFGKGKVEDLKALVAEKAVNLVVFDNELSAIQAYNLAKEVGVRIMDRTEIILEIFARRAVPLRHRRRSNSPNWNSSSRASPSPRPSSASKAASA